MSPTPRVFDRMSVIVAALLIGSSLAWSTVMIRSAPCFQAPMNAMPTMPSSPETRPAPAPLDLEAICARDLRQSLHDVSASAAKPDESLALQLIGTAIESDRRFAVFSAPNRPPVVRQAGAAIDGYEVVLIERGLARLRRADREIELRVPWHERIRREEQRP